MVQNTTKNLLIKNLKQIMPPEEANGELDFLLKEEFGLDRKTVLLNPEIIDKYGKKLQKIIDIRVNARKPLQYIINKAQFLNEIYYVDENVLIPRPETELLVSEVLKYANSQTKILDIGTGSGCIAISLAKNLNNKNITACDISSKAINIAKKNNKLICKEKKIKFIKSDLFSAIKGKFDIIVSNPPYVDFDFQKTMQPEVIRHEPHQALFAAENGLIFYKKIIKEAKNYLNKCGMIFFEIGINQSEAVKDLLISENFSNINIISDFSHIDRIITATI